jgi:hypothetical protein
MKVECVQQFDVMKFHNDVTGPFLPKRSTYYDPYWEADSHSAGPRSSHILCDPKVHYRVHKSSPMDPVLSQMNQVATPTNRPYLIKIYFWVVVFWLWRRVSCRWLRTLQRNVTQPSLQIKIAGTVKTFTHLTRWILIISSRYNKWALPLRVFLT